MPVNKLFLSVQKKVKLNHQTAIMHANTFVVRNKTKKLKS